MNMAAIKAMKVPRPVIAFFEHPWIVRVAHWLNAVAVFVLVGSGLRIFRAFPSFGPKIPDRHSRADHDWRLAGRCPPVALYLHVDFHR